jgi:hypothetical protein
MSIDFTKPVQTRDGRKVRILCTDAKSAAGAIVGLVISAGNQEYVEHWFSDGCFMADKTNDDRDLINVPPPKTKVQVEVRLVQTSDGVEAYSKCANGFDIWWPHEENEEVISSTTIEMEYQP